MPYNDPTLQDICLLWPKKEAELGTWMSIVPLVSFNIVELYHADRVKRQFNGEQPLPKDPVNVDNFLTTTGRGEDFWWPTKFREWYDQWRTRFREGYQCLRERRHRSS
ncbi:hypothetical protein AHAS_Ahas03G0149600 [Arachis hypogaea]